MLFAEMGEAAAAAAASAALGAEVRFPVPVCFQRS